MNDATDLSGRRALVMGAAAPVASAIALAFAAAGADVAATSVTNEAEEVFEVRQIAKRVRALGRRGIDEAVDLALGTNVQIAVRQVAKELGGIDLLVVAAELRTSKPAERLTDADWARAVNLNLSGVFYACRGVAREMLRQDPAPDGVRGRIIVLTPSAQELAATQDAAFVAAKAGVAALLQALAREWAPQGIVVSVLEVPSDADETSTQEAAEDALRLATAGPVPR